MDRHASWLRRRIIVSVAVQIGATFVLVALVTVALMQWRTDESVAASIFPAFVIALVVVLARIGYALRNNPLNQRFVRHFVESPFRYRVSRFIDEATEAHNSARTLPGFIAVATIRDDEASPAPVFDVMQDPSCLVAASVSRASGAIALMSLLRDGRVLVTDSRQIPPHASLVMNPADENTALSLISAHRRVMLERGDVVRIEPSAHQIVLRSLLIEHEAYRALGPWLSPFLVLESQSRSYLRLGTRFREVDLSAMAAAAAPTVAAQPVDTPPPDHTATPEVPATSAASAAPVLPTFDATTTPPASVAMPAEVPRAFDATTTLGEWPSLPDRYADTEVVAFEPVAPFAERAVTAPAPSSPSFESAASMLRPPEAVPSDDDPPVSRPRLSVRMRASQSVANRTGS